MSAFTEIPVIDFDGFDQDPSRQHAIAETVDTALSEVGFMAVRNLGIPDHMLHAVFQQSRRFFATSSNEKQRCGYRSASDNFGYQGVAQENLDPTAPGDLKETFTMRNLVHRAPETSRWPSMEFGQLMTDFYAVCLTASFRIMRALTLALNTDTDFFERCHSGENVTLRLLHYPPVDDGAVTAGQLGAGAHSDYGLLTLLFQNGVSGLEVQTDQGAWVPVAATEGDIVINAGDLLEVWTNGRYRSTQHRVQPRYGEQVRQSIALFVDPDSATEVAALPSCVSAANPARFAPTSAGAHLQKKIEASHKKRFEA
ncbi:MAG: 2OG-Fe(II) oxygenase family protein [Pseudomonadota bacterium]